MTDYAAVLSRNYAGLQWSLNGDAYSGLVWLEDTSQPSQAELDAAWPAVRDAIAWDAVRVKRDGLLSGSDWTQMPDAPLNEAEKQAWAGYRQTLRDIPQDFASPDAVVWPSAP